MASPLQTAILNQDLGHLLHELLFEQVPFVFSGAWPTYRSWRMGLATGLEVDPSEIIIVGSAAVGFSLSPTKGLRPFDKTSDIDVAVISHHFFSQAWHHLRSIDLTLDPLTPDRRRP